MIVFRLSGLCKARMGDRFVVDGHLLLVVGFCGPNDHDRGNRSTRQGHPCILVFGLTSSPLQVDLNCVVALAVEHRRASTNRLGFSMGLGSKRRPHSTSSFKTYCPPRQLGRRAAGRASKGFQDNSISLLITSSGEHARHKSLLTLRFQESKLDGA